MDASSFVQMWAVFAPLVVDDAQAQARRMFETFSQGKDHMDRSDIVASMHYLGYDCDDDYCTELLQTYDSFRVHNHRLI